ncbi:MAG: MFS transporter [Promethearchaeota archaeon]
MSKIENKLGNEMKYSSKIHASYAFGSFFDDFIMTAFGMRVYSFYETELFLPGKMIALAIIIYGIWNMFNDPIAGYLSDKNFKFTKKRGKRFTWFILMSFPTAIIYLLIFIPVGTNDNQIFVWLLVLICLYDTFFSFWNTNWLAIFPFKFRSQKERTKVAAFQTLLSQIGLTMGMLLPAYFFTYGEPETYINAAIFVMVVCFLAILVMIPGMKQDHDVLEHMDAVESEQEHESYIQTLKIALNEKNFRAYLTAYLGQTVMMTVMLASIPYLVNYVMGAGEDAEFLISAAVLAGGLVSVPLWIWVGRKFGNRIGYMCGTGFTATLLVGLFFVSMNYTLVVIFAGLVGFTMGATWSLMYPTFSDVIDEIVVKAKKRSEGIYYGFRTFIGRFSIVVQAATFGIVHTLTKFDPKLTSQPDSALLGIRIHTALVPALFYFLGFLAMWLIYDLKPAKVEKIKMELVELDL